MANKATIIVLAGALVLVSGTYEAADAVSERVKNACRNDYYAHCAEHAVGSDSLRFCMRRAQDRLSKSCLRELVAAGEVSKADIRRYRMRKSRHRHN
jgi:adenylate kinase